MCEQGWESRACPPPPRSEEEREEGGAEPGSGRGGGRSHFSALPTLPEPSSLKEP